ncbi:MAG: TetR family transcriptional regulator [Pseudonocardiaceae bacterium]|nr:TetR family transcriptional regulator [Pseudonocardiaceae bacterium]
MDVDEQPRQARNRRLPRAVRERQILDAAIRVFSERGYHNASMDEISSLAGVSKPMIYAYLGAKEDLFGTCIRQEARKLVQAVGTDIEPDAAPDVQLWHGIRSFLRFVGEHRESWTVLHQRALSQGEPFASQITAMRSQAITLVARLLTTAAVKKHMGEDATEATEALAAALVGASESAADWWVDHPETSERKLASWLMNLVWMGFGDLVDGNVWIPDS